MRIENIRRKGHFGLFMLDFLMVVLLLVNLTWIVFDWLFGYAAVRAALGSLFPEFVSYYAVQIHPRFILIDLMFVAVFLLEFFVAWIMAVRNKLYHRWFFYPVLHWYDLLGLIPIGGFRFLRLLRVFSITYRLQRVGVIDLSDMTPMRFARKYYGVVMEELSDRVTINILSDLQDEVRHGGPVADRILTDVVRPHKEELVEWMSHRIETVASHHYPRYRPQIRSYVSDRINHAFSANREFARLEQIPVFGSLIRSVLEKAISDVVFDVINGIMQDFASERNRAVLDELAELTFEAVLLHEEDSALGRIVVDTVDRSLEILKQHVRVQRWKIRDNSIDEEEFRRRLRDELERAVRETVI